MKKLLLLLIIPFLSFGQGSYDWHEHNEAMDNIDWGNAPIGLGILALIIGIIYLIGKNIK